MRNSLLAVLVAALAGNAAAVTWTVIDKGDPQTTYVDMDSIRTSQNTVKVWSMFDLKEAQRFKDGTPYMSSVLLYEHDCVEQRTRALSVAAYSGPMNTGDRIFGADRPSEWYYIRPGTIDAIRSKIACKK